MEQNDREIWLLNNDPAELLGIYQDLIKIIVRKYHRMGYVAGRYTEDLIQEVNRKLFERIQKIQKQYNGKSKLRTYFSVIIRNICLEEMRKQSKIEEPQSPDYHILDQVELPIDNFLIRQEYERYQKVLKFLFKDRARFIIMFRFIMELKISSDLILSLFPSTTSEDIEKLVQSLNPTTEMTHKAKFKQLSFDLNILEKHMTSPDSLRKWFASRSIECLELMNGDPPRSAYNIESLQLLCEKYEVFKNDQ